MATRVERHPVRRKLCATVERLAAVAGILAALQFGSTAIAEDKALSEADQTCLACHSSDALNKDLGEGKTLSLHIAPDDFAKSVHAVIGCAACHADVKVGEHPGKGQSIANARDYSIAMVEVCKGCHDEVFKQQEGSVHANLLRQGNRAAPVCTDCHGSHDVTPKMAYNTCVACHQSAMAGHGKWLPNAGLHLEIVSCAACHAPGAQRSVDLRLYDGATKTWVSEPAGAPYFEKLVRSVDVDGNGIDAAELRKLLQTVNAGSGAAPPKTFRGRIELRTSVEAHRLADKTRAIKDCASCHQQGAEPFQKVTLSVLGSDGRPVRYDAHQDVLSSALSVGSLREFYAVGGTRNRLLDALLVLAIVGGLAVPIGHQSLKWIVRKRMRSAEAPATEEHGTKQPPARGDRGGKP